MLTETQQDLIKEIALIDFDPDFVAEYGDEE